MQGEPLSHQKLPCCHSWQCPGALRAAQLAPEQAPELASGRIVLGAENPPSCQLHKAFCGLPDHPLCTPASKTQVNKLSLVPAASVPLEGCTGATAKAVG